MAGAARVGALRVDLGMNTAAFEAGATLAERRIGRLATSIRKAGQRMQEMGRTLSIGLTAPIVALGVAAVRGATAQAAAVGQVEAALASMGDVSGKTANELVRATDALEMRSLFDADVILTQVTANLLTFGNVAGEVFDRAQQSAVDMATRLGTEPRAAAMMLGKALNDPIRGIASLTRVGVQFTDQQRAMIAAMVAAGDTAGAQGVILDEVGRQFNGAAQAAADTAPWRQAQVAIAQAMDAIGEAILPLIPPITAAIVSMANAFRDMSPQTQKVVLVVAALAAAIGPLLLVFGTMATGFAAIMTAMKPFLGAIAVISASGGPIVAAKAALIGLGAALAPIAIPLAALAAAGYLIYRNWDTIGPLLQRLWGIFNDTIGPPLQNLVATLRDAFDGLFNGPLGPVLRALGPIVAGFGRLAATAFGQVLVQAVTAAAQATALMVNAIAGSIRILTRIFDNVMAQVRNVEAVFEWLYDRVVGNSHVPDMVDQIGTEMRRLDALMVDPARNAAQATEAAFREMASNVHGILARLFPEAMASNLYESERSALMSMAEGPQRDAALRALALERDALRGDNRPNVDLGLPETFALGADELTDAMGRLLGRTVDTTTQIATSFREMAMDTLNSLQRMTDAIKGGGFLDILQSVIGLGLQLGGMGLFGQSFAKKVNSPFGGALAMGGPVSTGKSYLVGENGPEMFTPSRGGHITPNGGGGSMVQVVPSPYFDVIVDGRIMSAAPALVQAGANAGVSQMSRMQSRRLG